MSTASKNPDLSIKKCVFYSIGLMVAIPLVILLVSQYAVSFASTFEYLLSHLIGGFFGILAIPMSLIIPIMIVISKITAGSVLIGLFTLSLCISRKKSAKIKHIKEIAPHPRDFDDRSFIMLEKYSILWKKKYNQSRTSFITLYANISIISGVSYVACKTILPEYIDADITTLATLIPEFYEPLLLSLDKMTFEGVALFNFFSKDYYTIISLVLFLYLPVFVEYIVYSIDVLKAGPKDFIKHHSGVDPSFYANM